MSQEVIAAAQNALDSAQANVDSEQAELDAAQTALSDARANCPPDDPGTGQGDPHLTTFELVLISFGIN